MKESSTTHTISELTQLWPIQPINGNRRVGKDVIVQNIMQQPIGPAGQGPASNVTGPSASLEEALEEDNHTPYFVRY